MNRSTRLVFIIPILFFGLFFHENIRAQKAEDNSIDTAQIANYREQIKRLMGFLEFSLNTLGDPETSTKEKEIIINESYSKAFLTDKVQVEDDLDENREILTYKDVQAYLKDVDFFFKQVEFKFEIQDIQSLKNQDGMAYFKVTANRSLKGETVEDEVLSNNKTRYIEINLDDEEQVLKIASIYTTRLNEAEELMAWWNAMPQEWKDFLGSKYALADSITLSQVDLLDDSTVLLVHVTPVEIEGISYIHIGDDSLIVSKMDTILMEKYDTIPVMKGAGYRALREIISLESLDVSGNYLITDLYPVSQLSELTLLDISNTMISDLFPARNLTKLLLLDISSTGIADLDPIRYNTKIMDLYLDSTLVSSLEPVSGFTSLEILHLGGSSVHDLQPVRAMSMLSELKLDDTPVSDLTPIADLPALERLSISGTQVESLESIQYMISLKRISFRNTSISDLAALSGLDSLQIIDADMSGISDLSLLGGITALEKVYCDQTGVTRNKANAFMAAHPNVLVIYESKGLTDWWKNLSPEWQQVFRGYATLDPNPNKEQLHKLTLVSSIDITDNKEITSLEPLSVMTNLKEIRASGTLIDDLKPLSGLSDLMKLSCADTKVSSLDPLQSNSRLEELYCTNSPVGSLEGLNGLQNLRILNIDGTNVKSLVAVKGHPALKYIYCDNTGISKDEIELFADSNPSCLIVNQTSTLTSWWNGLSSGWKYSFKAHTPVDDPPTREQLQTVASLRSLDLSGKREIIALEPIIMLKLLKDLNAANCALQNIDPLSQFVKLQTLNLSGNPLADLKPLGNLPALKVLDISNTPIEKLDDLKSLSTLEQLNCSGTQIKKLDPVYYLTSLKKLECQNTNINNLKPLTGLVQLKNLVCYNTKLNNKKVEAFKEEMPGVEVVFY